MSVKSNRVSSDMQKHLSEIIRDDVDNSDVKFITITSVELTDDKSYAKVYFTSLSENPNNVIEKALNQSANFIKNELGHRMQFRKNPTLNFVYDESIDYGRHIEDVISKLKDK